MYYKNMSEKSKAKVDDALERASKDATESRRKMVVEACRIVQAIAHDSVDRSSFAEGFRESRGHASPIPLVRLESDTKNGDSVIGTVGDAYAPGDAVRDAFNTGFLAAVLAVKANLVNPDHYSNDPNRQ